MCNIFRKNCRLQFGDLKSDVQKGDIVRMRVDSNEDMNNITFFLNGVKKCQINNLFFRPEITLFLAVGCYYRHKLSVTIMDE